MADIRPDPNWPAPAPSPPEVDTVTICYVGKDSTTTAVVSQSLLGNPGDTLMITVNGEKVWVSAGGGR